MLTAIVLSCALSQYSQPIWGVPNPQVDLCGPQINPLQEKRGLFQATSPDGKPLIGSQQYISKVPPSPTQSYGWLKRNRIREFSDPQLGVLLSDIEANMPADHEYRTNDRLTWAHETIHGISSALRMECGAGVNGFYVGKGYAMILREPKLPKSAVNQFVPERLRGSLWATYMANPDKQWEECPLYILDEFNAYIGGMEVYVELKQRGLPVGTDGRPGTRAYDRDLEHALEFCAYASALMQAVEKYCPDYPDKKRLESFISHQIDRTMILVQKIGREQHKQQAQQFAQAYVIPNSFGPKMVWNDQRHGWQGGIANTQNVSVAKEKAPFKPLLTVEQRLDRIEQTLSTLAKGIR